MIANLLDVARAEEGRLRPQRAPITVASLLGTLVDGYEVDAAMRRVDLSLELDQRLGVIDTDADLATRVIQNVVDNALRHTRPRGHVLVAARLDAAANELNVLVANDGTPLAPEIRGRLFKRNIGNEANGAGANRGLGLYFCRLAIEALGGRIALVEEPGYTVAFSLHLPLPAWRG
jgi:signal transduction histidine kinase